MQASPETMGNVGMYHDATAAATHLCEKAGWHEQWLDYRELNEMNLSLYLVNDFPFGGDVPGCG